MKRKLRTKQLKSFLALTALVAMLGLLAPAASAEIECFDGIRYWVNNYYQFVCMISSERDCIVCTDGVDACETEDSCEEHDYP